MTKQELESVFKAECTETGPSGNLIIKGTPTDLVNWIADKFCQPGSPPYSKAFTGMHDKNGKPVHEGDQIKLYYKGEYFTCRVVYDSKHAAFFIQWPDGYINHYFMNGSSYEVMDEKR